MVFFGVVENIYFPDPERVVQCYPTRKPLKIKAFPFFVSTEKLVRDYNFIVALNGFAVDFAA